MSRKDELRSTVRRCYFGDGIGSVYCRENDDGSLSTPLSVNRRLHLSDDLTRCFGSFWITVHFYDDGLLFETYMPSGKEDWQNITPLIVPESKYSAVVKELVRQADGKAVATTCYLDSQTGRIMSRYFLRVGPTVDLSSAHELIERAMNAVVMIMVVGKTDIDRCLET